ncbi:hypothetical protein CDN97_09385 [Pantoea sp. AMG 501]|jgi:integrating conjugative element protein (TIGR03757 family)|nr:hypothetical protein CDN97_09385 [Pantoea sp. AMG 501]
MKIPLCSLAFLLITAGSQAGTVIYTDHAHPVTGDVSPDVSGTELDAPDRIQAQLFGPLSANPTQAEQQARAVIASPAFRQNQLAHQRHLLPCAKRPATLKAWCRTV